MILGEFGYANRVLPLRAIGVSRFEPCFTLPVYSNINNQLFKLGYAPPPRSFGIKDLGGSPLPDL